MTRRLRRALTAVAACALLAVPVVPVRTDWIVFDPHNFAQNVLTAACELQQVNNEIQSLQNQAQMLINQARDLASLPYSALKQLEQSIAQTQQLLAQAQNIAYSVTAINQAFTTTYPQSYPPKPGGSLSRSRIAGPALRTANARRCSNRSTALRVRGTPAASVSALPSPARSPASTAATSSSQPAKAEASAPGSNCRHDRHAGVQDPTLI